MQTNILPKIGSEINIRSPTKADAVANAGGSLSAEADIQGAAISDVRTDAGGSAGVVVDLEAAFAKIMLQELLPKIEISAAMRSRRYQRLWEYDDSALSGMDNAILENLDYTEI